ncbi:MAG TPA: hypothetical protein VG892_11705 [Terriglobales bacterium]|nr:hypothetical protein [Terriglobales bacterium]
MTIQKSTPSGKHWMTPEQRKMLIDFLLATDPKVQDEILEKAKAQTAAARPRKAKTSPEGTPSSLE